MVDYKGNASFTTSKCISYKLVTGVTTHITYLIINVSSFQLLLIVSSIKDNY